MRIFRTFVAGYTALLIFLAPVKFGTILYTGRLGLFPLSTAEWLFGLWPPALMPLLSSLALIGAAIAFHPPGFQWRRPGWLLVLPWALLLLGALPAVIGSVEQERALLFIGNLLASLSLAVAVLMILRWCPAMTSIFLFMLTAGVFAAVADGWYEVKGGGLEATLEEAEKLAAVQNRTLDPDIRERLEEGRASGTFFYPNSYAGYLILTLPVCLAALWHWGGRIDPPRISRILFLTVAGVGGGMALLWSGSRAALLALGIGMVFATLCTQLPRKWRFGLAAVMLVAGLSGVVAVNRGRSLSSLEARLNYWAAAVDMAKLHPIRGVGLGEFYPEFSARLEPGEEITRQPHNFWLLFAAEAGIAGAIAATILLSLPLWFDRLSPPGTRSASCCIRIFAIRTGLTAWVLHSLTDLNFHVPGMLTTAAVIPLFILYDPDNPGDEEAEDRQAGSSRRRAPLQLPLAVLALTTLLGSWRLPGDLAMTRLVKASTNPHFQTAEVEKFTLTAARLLPCSPYPWLVLADVAASAGRPQTTADACREALQRTPHRGAIWARLADAEHRLGNSQKAKFALQQAERWGNPSLWNIEE